MIQKRLPHGQPCGFAVRTARISQYIMHQIREFGSAMWTYGFLYVTLTSRCQISNVAFPLLRLNILILQVLLTDSLSGTSHSLERVVCDTSNLKVPNKPCRISYIAARLSRLDVLIVHALLTGSLSGNSLDRVCDTSNLKMPSKPCRTSSITTRPLRLKASRSRS